MLAIKNSKSYVILPSPPNLESITIRITSSTPVTYCLVYIPPKSSNKYLQEFCNFLTDFNTAENFVLLGDFNFNDINWDSLHGHSPSFAKFCDIVFELNFIQLIDEPTHIHGNTLNLVLTNNIDIIHDLSVHSSSLYLIIIITFKIHSNITHPSNRLVTKLPNFSNVDFDGLCHYLNNSDFTPCFQSDDIEFVWSFISSYTDKECNSPV